MLRALGALGALPTALAHQFREDSRSTLFSAALAVIATHAGALGILVKLSLLIVANLASQSLPVLEGRGPVVLLMDEAYWQERYFEQSPLDRCAMAADLDAILAHGPRAVAVDFDLSPALRPADAACQATLDALLDRHAARLVLLAPFKVGAPRLIEQKRDWMLARCKAGGVFADGGLELSLGMVIDSLPGEDRMAEVVRRRAGSTICASLATPAGVERWLARRGDDAGAADHVRVAAGPGGVEGAAEKATEAEPVAINFAYFRSQVHKLGLEQLSNSGITDWARRDVFFGGDYGSAKEDRFGTPIGPLPGIAVHAARRVSLDRPVAELQPVAGFAADIMIAFVFSLGIAAFWSRYAHLRVSRSRAERQLASVMVVGFIAFYLLLVFLFFQLGTDLFAAGILIAPLVIALSMLVDGFITGPIGAVLKEVRHEAEQPAARGEFRALICVAVALVIVLKLVHLEPLSWAGAPLVMLAAAADHYGMRGLAGVRWRRRLPAVTTGRAILLLLAIVIAGVGVTHFLLRTGAVAFSHAYTEAFFITLACIAAALAVGMVYPLARAHEGVETREAADGSAGTGARRLGALVTILKKLIFWGAVYLALAFLFH